MLERAGQNIGEDYPYADRFMKIKEYLLGDMTSIVYPVGGGLEDWAYAAGWDTAPDAAMKVCKP